MAAPSDRDRVTVAALYRRAGFGLEPGALDEQAALGVPAVIDLLVDPEGNDVPANPDPWQAVTFHDFADDTFRRDDRRASVRAWIAQMITTPRPLEEWTRWFWHGHLATSLADVKNASLMVAQLRMFGDLGLGSFRELLRAATIDPAMLLYLNGSGSVAAAPNENYGRELMELFALGVGNYSEDDVKNAAAALTGWRTSRVYGDVTFNPNLHDDAPRTLVGVDAVHDLDTVIDAVVAHDACPRWIAACMAEAVLGAGTDEDLIDDLAAGLRRDDMAVRPLLRAILEAGVDGAFRPMILRPVPWVAMMARAAGVVPHDDEALSGVGYLVSLGQTPMYPPNVAGWPGDTAWLGAGVTISRFNTATRLAALTSDGAPVLEAAAGKEWDQLAALLMHPEGFGDGTINALVTANRAGGRAGAAALAVAMSSPEVIQA